LTPKTVALLDLQGRFGKRQTAQILSPPQGGEKDRGTSWLGHAAPSDEPFFICDSPAPWGGLGGGCSITGTGRGAPPPQPSPQGGGCSIAAVAPSSPSHRPAPPPSWGRLGGGPPARRLCLAAAAESRDLALRPAWPARR